MDDPRFKHIASDPRFKGISKRSRKVTIDSRFQSMFDEDRFKIKYKVDKRGRKVKQTSSENLRKYYELEKEEIHDSAKEDSDESAVKYNSDESAVEANSDESAVEANSDESAAESTEAESSDDSDEESSSDEEQTEEVLEAWHNEQEHVPLTEDSSHRLAVCNMDWDRIEAKDIFVLLSSFKPSGSSITSVSVFQSDFGLERQAQEEVKGPAVLVGRKEREGSGDGGSEGAKYSREELRKYQISRFKYYYAVVECDTSQCAEHIYEQCNGLEYEHSGGQLDLRFIPGEVSFDDRQPKSVVDGGNVPADFIPADFVSSALQQSKIKLTWDETESRRLKVTQKKFTKDDIQSMEFNAYLASSSDEGDGDDGDKVLRYKELLGDLGEGPASDSKEPVLEEMEITWEPGLKETAEVLVKKKRGKDSESKTQWELYQQKRKEKRKETKKKIQKKDAKEEEGKMGTDSGFDDPFFQHSVTMATSGSTKSRKGKRKRDLDETELKERNELELLMMSDDEGGETERQHFNLPSILKSERDSNKKRKKRKKEKLEEAPPVDTFKVDVSDSRFEALYKSHLYAPDPSAPQYRATKGMTELMKEKQRRGRSYDNNQQPSSISGEGSLNSLVKSVKSKSAVFKEKKRKIIGK